MIKIKLDRLDRLVIQPIRPSLNQPLPRDGRSANQPSKDTNKKALKN